MNESRSCTVGCRLGCIAVLALVVLGPGLSRAQDAPLFTPHFPAEEFVARRSAIASAIGSDAVALLQGAPSPPGYTRFRQSNEFFYLTGIESPHAYLLIEPAGRSTLYLRRRDTRREASEGKLLSADDAELVKRYTGVDAVRPVDELTADLEVVAGRARTLSIPLAPAEGLSMSRDLAVRGNSDVAADPLDGRPGREQHLRMRLQELLPQIAIADLTPTLDSMRRIKTERELTLIRRATQISMVALLESMRSVHPGMLESEIDALAQFVFLREGAQGTAYYSLVGAGPNAWYPHYHKGGRLMQDGDFLLVDVGPDYAYYSTDVTRMLPVNGRFNDWQRELYGFYLATYRALLESIRPGEVADIAREAAAKMERIVDGWEFSKPQYEEAARSFVGAFVSRAERGATSLGHWVGMAVHDVGEHDGTLRPGMVFTIEPQFRVPGENIYIRLEDVILITPDGAEVLSRDLPMDIDDIEAMMHEDGLLQRYPRLLPPLPAAR